jgi:putative MATE family efflux protein
MSGPTIDMIWVGKLGAASIAGVGVAGMAVQLVTGLMMGISTGLRAMVARFVGAGENERANHVAKQAFVVSAAFAILITAVGIFLAEQIMSLFGLAPDVIAEGVSYIRIMFVGSSVMSFVIMVGGIMQASGDTVTPMRITVGTRLLHITLCPFLIFGWWIFPRMGVSGAALTNVISQGLGLVLMLWILYSGRTRLKLTLSGFRFDFNIIWRMVKIGIPASLTMLQYQFGTVVLLGLIAPFGTAAVAAHTVVQRAEMFIMMPSSGLGMAAGVLAGQNLGAGQAARAEKSGWLAAGLVTGVTCIGAAVILLWPKSIVGIFSSDPDVVAMGSTFLKIAIIGYFMIGVASVLFNCLTHVGDTVPPMVFVLVAVWLVELPLAFFLPEVTGLGVYAIRWAIVAHTVVLASAMIIYFQHGRWKRKKI